MFRALLVLALASAPLAWTQATPDDTVMASSPKEITIELDSSQTRNAQKSLGLALLSSAILPGAGEAYLQEDKSARNFLLVEAGFWAGLSSRSRRARAISSRAAITPRNSRARPRPE